MTRIEAIRQRTEEHRSIVWVTQDKADIDDLLTFWDTRETALRALVEHLDESAVAAERYPGAKSNAETYRYIRAKLSRLLEQEP